MPNYLPFWDQYVRSQTVWSPDGEQFAHVGRAGSGESGVWIHDASTSGRSTLLAAGDLAEFNSVREVFKDSERSDKHVALGTFRPCPRGRGGTPAAESVEERGSPKGNAFGIM